MLSLVSAFTDILIPVLQTIAVTGVDLRANLHVVTGEEVAPSLDLVLEPVEKRPPGRPPTA